MKKALIIFSLVLLGACQSMTATTTYPGINYGDSLEKVISVVGKRDRIVEQSDSRLIAFGKWDLIGDCRKKVFVFYEGSGLQQLSFEPAPDLSVENNCE